MENSLVGRRGEHEWRSLVMENNMTQMNSGRRVRRSVRTNPSTGVPANPRRRRLSRRAGGKEPAAIGGCVERLAAGRFAK